MPLSQKSLFFLFFVFTALFCGCKQPKEQHEKKHISKDTFIQANKSMVKTEDQKIEDYITRYKWQMTTTSTGLRYMIYKQGNGEQIKSGQSVTYSYTLSLLDGQICYSSDENGPKTIMLGKGEVERGLEEGILFLKKGDRAKFIIPSHLAFGLVGDGNRIPAKATIVYDIEIIQLK